ncbi:MarR family winged helix-turn-helix transcriptional regulator [Paenibacillus sp. CF384]|uniref:MarR family winged helix-turn-helix transcriptional regulator n=1 Tax=Paenibacillus sp. CF384 TaxID=1884382 RepID=UPI0008999B92|nr:MarR family transcriptional regulator [Paenibacillus sp. CF384]SDX57744.1 transcriptional regulator, MarR family [Paenibacillus sp. CF384]
MDDEQRILQIFHSYREVNQAFFHVMKKVAQQHQITPIQLIVIRILREHPEIKLTELAEKLNLGSSTASGIIDRMVRDELVYRERTEADRRAMTLTLTDKGRTLWEESNETRTLMFQPLLQLSEEDQHQFLRIQTEILGILRKVKEDGAI